MSSIWTHLPMPKLIRHSFRIWTSSLLHPGEGVKFHLQALRAHQMLSETRPNASFLQGACINSCGSCHILHAAEMAVNPLTPSTSHSETAR